MTWCVCGALLITATCGRVQAADDVRAVADALVPVAASDVHVGGFVGDLQNRFFARRIVSDYAKTVIWQEARDAFAHPDDDVFNKGIGMWKGEFWGKLMISACRVADYLHDAALKEFLHQEALRLIAFQQPDGYLGTYTNKEYVQPMDLAYQKRRVGWACDWNWNLWCRKYTLWGLLSAYRLTGDRKILHAAEKAMTQQIEMLKRLNIRLCDTGTTCMRSLPPCSILKPLLLLYEETHDARYRDYAREIVGYFDDPTSRAVQFRTKLATGLPLDQWYPTENGRWGKAYEMMSCLAGFVEYYRVTGGTAELDIARGMCERILSDELNLCFSVGYNDQLFGARKRLNGVSEPCDAIHWMRLNHELYLVSGEAKYVDAIERCFYNAFLAAIRPDGAWGARCVRSHGRHYPAPPQSGMKLQHCCVNNMPRGFMDAAQTVLAHDAQGVLYVGLYHDSTSAWDGNRVSISGGYPISNDVTVVVTRRTAGKVRFRVPDWCSALSVCGDVMCQRTKKKGWFDITAPAGTSTWHLAFECQPRILDSQRTCEHDDETLSRVLRQRWMCGEKDIASLFRTKPAVQVMYGPLMLAKSVKLGEDETTILDSATVNNDGWNATLEPTVSSTNTWGTWNLTFRKGDQSKSLKVCDYASAATWSGTSNVEFSVFF